MILAALLGSSNAVYAQDSPTARGEFIVNVLNSSYPVTITVSASTVWNANKNLTSSYHYYSKRFTSNPIYNFDHVVDANLNLPIIGYGSYSVNVTVEDPYGWRYYGFSADWTDCDYNAQGYFTPDITVEIDDNAGTYYYVQGNDTTSYGPALYIWDQYHKSPSSQNTSGFQPTNPSNLQVTASGGHPYLTWNASQPSGAKYNVESSDASSGPYVNISGTIDTTSYTDYSVITPGSGTFWYRIQGVSGDGSKVSPGYSNSRWISGDAQSVSPQVVKVEYYQRAYPNPFNPLTTIEYGLPDDGHVSLIVYNTLGQLVRILVGEEKPAGRYEVRWDGRDADGQDVPSGMYFSRIVVGSFTETKKMILVR